MDMKKMYTYIGGIAICMALTACGNDQQAQQTAPETTQQEAVVTTPAAPPAAAAANKGKVMETMDASGYTYVRLDDNGKEYWAAVPKTQLEVGEEITLQGGSVMTNFSSKSLERTFEEIIFASGVVRGGDQVAVAGGGADSFSSALQSAGGAAEGASSGSAGAVVAFADLKIEKAAGDNAQTVADAFANATTLNEKPVAIKGQVVKISRNIMGKNWLHLQDGTGDPNSATHDLVVTTAGEAEKGAIVTIEGTLYADKDFGSGYKYSVIVEDAVISQ